MNAQLEKIKELLEEADFVLIGAGAGLSSAAGFEYGGLTFMRNFKYMHDLYGYRDMYSAGFHPFFSSEEKWGYWSKFIHLNRYQGVKPLYQRLMSLIREKDYFVLTTNVDHQFQLAGIDKARLFYTQGDYGLFQCSLPCHNKTYDNEETIRAMVGEMKDHKIPSRLIPTCPVCGKEMSMNLRSDDTFVEDEGWHKAAGRYMAFLERAKKGKTLLIELGVGFNTPGIIKYPFMRFVYENKATHYVVINKGNNVVPKEIEDRSILLDMDILKAIGELS
ncbi:MAG: Sir2 silent information regulator family NAD-dependent deacetylase [Bacilli bacterium]|nr:Sir2 silent information regulator family NAD-dependent deacetylase [Bacilli bacterium]